MKEIVKKSKLKRMLIIILLILMTTISVHADTIFINGIGEVSVDQNVENIELNGRSFWNELFSKYKELILGFAGLAVITVVGFFVLGFVRLGKSGGNPEERSKALNSLLWTGIATIGLGSVGIIIGYAYNFLV